MKLLLLQIAKACMRFIYFFMKLLPLESKICFISRQADKPGIDFLMLQAEMKAKYPQYKQVTLCRKIPEKSIEQLGYCFHILAQMYHVATSKLVVLDTYCIPVSVLKHRKELVVLQIWHALGAFKKFGLSTAGRREGSDEKLAEVMNMHRGYSCALCSGDCCAPCFAQAFGMAPEKMIVLGLPRMDYLTRANKALERARIESEYPALHSGKKTILYVPTFRRANGVNDYDLKDASQQLASSVDLSRYNLIIKTHSGEELIYTDSQRCGGNSFTGLELLFAADFVITDYSSIVFEATLAGVPIFLWCYDFEEYGDARGFYLDFPSEIPAFFSQSLPELLFAIDNYSPENSGAVEAFVKRYTAKADGRVCEELARLCGELASGSYDGHLNYRPKLEK